METEDLEDVKAGIESWGSEPFLSIWGSDVACSLTCDSLGGSFDADGSPELESVARQLSARRPYAKTIWVGVDRLFTSFLVVHKSRSRYNAATGADLAQPIEEP